MANDYGRDRVSSEIRAPIFCSHTTANALDSEAVISETAMYLLRAIFLFSVLFGALALGFLGTGDAAVQALIVLSVLASAGARL